MGIFSRFSDIVQANINAMLDRAEDPEKMIRMMISEMEETLIEVRSSSARIIADRKTAERRLNRMKAEISEWERKAKLAIEKGREDLARAALSEKQVITEDVDTIEQDLQVLDDNLAKLDQEISQLQGKLQDAKAKEKTLKMRQEATGARIKAKRQTERASVEEAFAKFEQFERRMDHYESELEVMDLGKEGASLKQQFTDLENDDKINAELERLKTGINKADK
ncbi:MAG: phage shock protein PspA [Cellvibrionaceae bacterium]|nr:phage shock protein PspA [Cellvibrionaceae bacterium]